MSPNYGASLAESSAAMGGDAGYESPSLSSEEAS
jgi:hypothetical protein